METHKEDRKIIDEMDMEEEFQKVVEQRALSLYIEPVYKTIFNGGVVQ